VTSAGGAYRLGGADPVLIIELSVTSWCNYRCAYCVTAVQPRRADAAHAFDHHPVAAWVGAFARLPGEFALLCRGGEPFLDHAGFGAFLAGVGALPALRYVRVDTNGSWAPEKYAAVPIDVRRKVQLNVSFHPTQLALDAFAAKLARILDAGWQVAMINYVMEAGQAGAYAEVRDYFRARHDIYVNPNPDAFDPAWAGPDRVAGATALVPLLPALDRDRKTGAPTLGKACGYPTIGFFVGPDGRAERACGVRVHGEPRAFDFIGGSAQLRALPGPVRCPQRECGCLDRYAFLAEAEERGRALDLLGEYVGACRAHQATARS
jgi:hypothetical protein